MQFHPSNHLVEASPFPVYVGYLFFGGIQSSPVDGCSIPSCNFGVLAGEHECTSFYSTINRHPTYEFSSVAQSCPTLCGPMNRSTPGLLVRHKLLEFTQTHVHQVSDAIQPSHPLSAPSPLAPNPSQHQGLFQ